MTAPAEELLDFFIDSCRFGDIEDVKVAIQEKAAVDGQDHAGRTALHMASANGHVDVVKLLLDAGATPDMKNSDGNTPLHWACLNGHMEVVKLLLEKGGSAAVLNNAGRTPVDEAISKDNSALLELINSYNTGGGVEVEVVEEDAGPSATGEAEAADDEHLIDELSHEQQHEQQPEQQEQQQPALHSVHPSSCPSGGLEAAGIISSSSS